MSEHLEELPAEVFQSEAESFADLVVAQVEVLLEVYFLQHLALLEMSEAWLRDIEVLLEH